MAQQLLLIREHVFPKAEGCLIFQPNRNTLSVALRMHYVGTFKDNGQVFDSSERAGQPIRFPVGRGQVIRGWDEGAARRWRPKAIEPISHEF